MSSAPSEISSLRSDLRPLLPLAGMLLVLVVLELMLELRHYHRCFDTPIFGQKQCSGLASPDNSDTAITSNSPAYGPVSTWPYRSRVPEGNLDEKTILWIASSSHAEHQSLPAQTIFPNRICEKIDKVESCLVVNGSKAGDSIDRNIQSLSRFSPTGRVDKAILYQMAIFISRQQRKQEMPDGGLASNTGNAKDPSVELASQRLFASVSEALRTGFQRTSLYLHLSEYIGGTVKLAGFKRDDIDGIDEEYMRIVHAYVNFCRDSGIEPVLTTFAIAYDVSNSNDVPTSMARTFVRKNPLLSTAGFARTVERLNNRIESYATNEKVKLIDLGMYVGGKPEYFVDMIHFNEAGHDLVAAIIAQHVQADG